MPTRYVYRVEIPGEHADGWDSQVEYRWTLAFDIAHARQRALRNIRPGEFYLGLEGAQP